MDEKVLKFFKKYNIHINDIKYLLRQNNKTCIYTTDERVIKTFITVKDLFKELRPCLLYTSYSLPSVSLNTSQLSIVP